MAQQNSSHLIVLTSGEEDNGARATLAFSLGLTLAAMECKVAVFLDSKGVVWAFEDAPRGVNLPGFESLEDYMTCYAQEGGEIFVHSNYLGQIDGWSESAARHDTYGPIRDGIVRAGVTTMATMLVDRKYMTF